MEYQRAIKYLIDRRLKLILLSSKVGREREYFEEYMNLQEEIKTLDYLIERLENGRKEEVYAQKTAKGQLELL